jgi:hypothetical protein
MVISGYLRRPRLNFLLAALVTTIFAGCQKPEQIRSYSVPKEVKAEVAKAEPAATPVKTGDPTDRMLAAILPAGGQAWFFKVVGPIPAIDKLEKEFNDFFTTIRFADDGKPKWQLPTGWKEAPGNTMRFATIVVPSDRKPLEITVNALPWSGTPADMLSNVNRWRGQLQLPPIAEDKIAESTHEAKAGELPITIVDLRGNFAGGMSPPFAGAGARPGAAPTGPPNLPPGHPPIDSASSQPTTPPPQSQPGIAPPDQASVSVPKFTAPADWKVQGVAPGGFRKAAFTIGDTDPSTEVTLIDFPANGGSMMADPLANTNRWRREVGLGDLKQDELAKANELIEIDGKPAILVRAIPDASQASESKANLATLGAMIKTGDTLWFVKLKGDRTVVTAQEEAFKTFLKSLRFAADAGATDGNK